MSSSPLSSSSHSPKRQKLQQIRRTLAVCVFLSISTVVWAVVARYEFLDVDIEFETQRGGGRGFGMLQHLGVFQGEHDHDTANRTMMDAGHAQSSSSSSSHSSSYPQHLCSAQFIVQEAYDRVYRNFVQRCQPGMAYVKDCIATALDDESSPWWLEGLFRDSYLANDKLPLYLQRYHKIWFDNPQFRYCRIEKVASSQWLNIFHDYHGQPLRPLPPALAAKLGTDAPPPHRVNSGWGDNTAGAPQVVFFRDPLERFLSAYLDKCEKKSNGGQHCKPFDTTKDLNSNNQNQFRHNKMSWLRTGSKYYNNNKRQAFSAYVHTFPLEWDVHFVPQALYCDGLFRTLPDYAFVGSMQDDVFLRDMMRLINQFLKPDTKLLHYVNSEFKFESNDLNNATTNFRDYLERQNKTHPTGSTKKLSDYYHNADLVRQVLEYYAIDYVTLKLAIPSWIQEILDDDCRQKFGGGSGAATAAVPPR